MSRDTALSSIKYVVFDFDGTICDSYKFAIDAFNKAAYKFSLKKIKSDSLDATRDLTMKELFSRMEIQKDQIPRVIDFVLKNLGENLHLMHEFIGIREELIKLKAKKLHIGILTSNNERNIRKFLKTHDLELFGFVYSKSSVFGKEKSLRILLDDLKVLRNEVVYVGDETRDIEATQLAGVPIIAVSWGFNSKSLLKKYNPTFLIDAPSKLANLFY